MRQLKFRVRWQREDGKVFTQIFEWDDLPSIKYLDGETISVDQFTGLKDKNGKEIYEGDILADDIGVQGEKLEKPMIAEVRWEESSAEFTTLKKGAVDVWFAGKSPFCDWSQCEVVGNIYDNPNLLNNKQI